MGVRTYFANRFMEEVIEKDDWPQIIFSGVNLALLIYALFVFIGIRPLIQDLAIGIEHHAKQVWGGVVWLKSKIWKKMVRPEGLEPPTKPL